MNWSNNKLVLLLQTCCADFLLTRQLLNRVSQLDAWSYFDGVAISLDGDLEIAEVEECFLPVIPFTRDRIEIRRSKNVDSWTSNNVETALEVYKWACSFGNDVLKIDSDIFIANQNFFLTVTTKRTGISGRLMPFFIESYLCGESLHFIQGGVVVFGNSGREFILNLTIEEVNHYRNHVWNYISIGDQYKRPDYIKYFTDVEDVVLLGIMPRLNNLEMENINRIQVSPYDLISDFKTAKINPESLAMLYKGTGSFAYHYEGSQWGMREYMRKCLKWIYTNSNKFDL
jgi:hypothetical protein